MLPFPTLEVPSSFGFNKIGGLDGITTQHSLEVESFLPSTSAGDAIAVCASSLLLLDLGEAPQLVSEVV